MCPARQAFWSCARAAQRRGFSVFLFFFRHPPPTDVCGGGYTQGPCSATGEQRSRLGGRRRVGSEAAAGPQGLGWAATTAAASHHPWPIGPRGPSPSKGSPLGVGCPPCGSRGCSVWPVGERMEHDGLSLHLNRLLFFPPDPSSLCVPYLHQVSTTNLDWSGALAPHCRAHEEPGEAAGPRQGGSVAMEFACAMDRFSLQSGAVPRLPSQS